MKFSIVTISYNQAQFLEQAIRSVTEQDYPDVEYIVVDPGSTDGSREIIKRYRDRIDKIIFEPDNGPADGLNKGFSCASGNVYGFLNSDDFLLPGALSKISEIFSNNRKVDVVSGHGYISDEQGNIVRRIYSDEFSLTLSAYGACILIQPSTFFRAAAYDRAGGFVSTNKSNWDGELFIDMALSSSQFSRIDEILSVYRVHPNSITGSGNLRLSHTNHRKRMFEKVFCREQKVYDSVIAFLLTYVRKIKNPRDTYERIVRGPVSGGPSR